jgi:hypothetical protein
MVVGDSTFFNTVGSLDGGSLVVAYSLATYFWFWWYKCLLGI